MVSLDKQLSFSARLRNIENSNAKYKYQATSKVLKINEGIQTEPHFSFTRFIHWPIQ